MRAVLFHNPKAGIKGHRKEDILAALKMADHSVSYVSSKSDGFRPALEKIEKSSADFVIAAGGDGTVTEVILKLPDRSLPIGILPLGTANNIARSLGIAGTPQILVEGWRPDEVRCLDIGLAEGPWGATPFLEAFGVGIFAQLFIAAKKKKKPVGADNLLKGRALLKKIIEDAGPLDLDVLIDGKHLEGKFLGVEVQNIPYTGPGLPVAPEADPGDGLLDLVCFEAAERAALIEWIDSPQDSPPPATIRQGRDITLIWTGTPHRIDDEFFDAKDKAQTAEISCQREPARIFHAAPAVQAAAPPPRMEPAT